MFPRMPSDRESPPYIHRLPCGPDTREWPILWRNLWAWFCANVSRITKMIKKFTRSLVYDSLSCEFWTYHRQLCVQQCVPHQVAGVPWDRAVGASPGLRAHTHPLRLRQTAESASIRDHWTRKFRCFSSPLFSSMKEQKVTFENQGSTLTALQTPRPSVLPQP